MDLPIEKAQIHSFKKSLSLNAQVIQLSNAQQAITSLIEGHLEKYFVKPGQKVKKGDKIALIRSMKLSKMSAEYISYKQQYKAVVKNYEAQKRLYEKGMSSMQKLNEFAMQKDAIEAKLQTLRSQLATLLIDVNDLKKPQSYLILYAHSDGEIAQLLKPLHSSVTTDEAVVWVVKEQAYYIQSYLPLEYAQKVQLGDKIVAYYNHTPLVTFITQIMPEVDKETQRVVVLSSVADTKEKLFINVYLPATLYFSNAKHFVAVKKSALSFFQNEWVVFVPHHDDEEDGKEEHEAKNDGDDEHEHHEEEVPYTLKVVEVVAEDENFVGIKGLQEGEEYVSDKSYYVKSLLLKSSLGGHGH